jgi:predicted RNase H-like HicB family nuclease
LRTTRGEWLRRQHPGAGRVCVSQGDGRTEANIRGATELYVEDCRDAGDPVPTEAGKEFVEVEAA